MNRRPSSCEDLVRLSAEEKSIRGEKELRIKMPEIFEVTEITDEILEALQRLIPQLTSSRRPPTREELRSMVRSPSTTLLIARDDREDHRIIGTLNLVLYPLPTGLRARIEPGSGLQTEKLGYWSNQNQKWKKAINSRYS